MPFHHGEYGRIDWPLLARTAQTPTALNCWFDGAVSEQSPKAEKARRILDWALSDATARQRAEDFVGEQLAAAAAVDANLTTVLDDDYPANLRLVSNAQPFLFHRGPLQAADARSIAVVGTRQASPDGQARAARMARWLSDAGWSWSPALRAASTRPRTSPLVNQARSWLLPGRETHLTTAARQPPMTLCHEHSAPGELASACPAWTVGAVRRPCRAASEGCQ